MVPQGISANLNATAAPTALQAAFAGGRRWMRQIGSGKVANVAAISKAENVDRSYVSRMINLTTVAPEIQAAILDETLPGTVSLFDLASDTPLSWEQQRRGLKTYIDKGCRPFPRLAGERDQPARNNVPECRLAERYLQQLQSKRKPACPQVCGVDFATRAPVIDHAGNNEEQGD